MEFYPLNKLFFSNLSVTASFAVSSSFIVNRVPSASHTLFPTGAKGPTGDSCGQIYLLASSLQVCNTTTTTTTSTTTTTTSTTTTSTTTTTTTLPPGTTTTTTTTIPPTCGGYCNPQLSPGRQCGNTCDCQNLEPSNPYSEVGRCVDKPAS